MAAPESPVSSERHSYATCSAVLDGRPCELFDDAMCSLWARFMCLALLPYDVSLHTYLPTAEVAHKVFHALQHLVIIVC